MFATNCVTCSESVENFTECGRCGSSVHFREIAGCGAWLLDRWDSDAVKEQNGFWCIQCLEDVYFLSIRIFV